MAYRAAASTSSELFKQMKELGLIKSNKVEQVLQMVDRKKFLTYPDEDHLLRDVPEYIGHNATISAPHMHIFALEILESQLNENGVVMDVGSGSGYLTLCFALMIGNGAKVIGLEHVPQLVEKSKQNIRDAGYANLLEDGTIEIIVQDGRNGYPKYSPYDAIHVGAAAEHIPQDLVDQLKDNGRMVLPIDNEIGYQDYISLDKKSSSDDYKIEKLMPVSYVRLTDIDKQLNREGNRDE